MTPVSHGVEPMRSADPRLYRLETILAAALERSGSFVDQLADDVGDRLLAGDPADRLAGHHRAALDVAVDHRAAQRTGPIMLDLQLCLAHFDRTLIELVRDFALLGGEVDHLLVLERPYGDHRQARIDLHRRDRVTRRGADEGLREVRVGDALVSADEARAELDPNCAHLEIGGDCLAAADAAGDEYRNVLADIRQD